MRKIIRRSAAVAMLAAFLVAGSITPRSLQADTMPLAPEAAELVVGAGCLGCALSLAATLTASVSAIFIAGPAALAVWAVGKGLATASLIDSCSTCEM
jgi:hypothetical protein